MFLAGEGGGGGTTHDCPAEDKCGVFSPNTAHLGVVGFIHLRYLNRGRGEKFMKTHRETLTFYGILPILKYRADEYIFTAFYGSFPPRNNTDTINRNAFYHWTSPSRRPFH